MERKGWINNGVMPKTDDDDDLNRFMHENEFHRSQLQTKFRDLMKQYRDTSEVDKDIKDSHIYQNLIRRVDGATTKDLLSIIIKKPLLGVEKSDRCFVPRGLKKIFGA